MDWQLVVLRIKRVFGLTDAELASRIGCTEAQIRELRRGTREPKYTVGVELMKWKGKADGFGKEADQLGKVSEGQA